MRIHGAQAQVLAQLHSGALKPLRSDCLTELKCRIFKEFLDLVRHDDLYLHPLYSRGRSNPTRDYAPVLKDRYPA